MSGDTFAALIQRVRDGDSVAWTKLFEDYGPVIIEVARARLGRYRVGLMLEPEDIRQSVMRSFFRRVTSGQFDLGDPSQLNRLLKTMARNKSINKIDVERRRSAVPLDGQIEDYNSAEPRPDETAAHRESMRQVLQQLSRHEKELFKLRMQGHSWASIAQRFGERADALRKRLSRALESVRAEELLSSS